MKILFANMPWFEKTKEGVLMKGCRAGSRWPNLFPATSNPDNWIAGSYSPFVFFLAGAASYVAKHCAGATVALRDSMVLHESYGKFWRYLQDEKPDLIFFESATPCWPHDKKLIERMGEFAPQAKIAICGPIAHPSSGHQAEILAIPNVCAVIAGEYEKGCVRVVNGETGAIPFESLF